MDSTKLCADKKVVSLKIILLCLAKSEATEKNANNDKIRKRKYQPHRLWHACVCVCAENSDVIECIRVALYFINYKVLSLADGINSQFTGKWKQMWRPNVSYYCVTKWRTKCNANDQITGNLRNKRWKNQSTNLNMRSMKTAPNRTSHKFNIMLSALSFFIRYFLICL